MWNIFKCRRSSLAVIAIAVLGWLSYEKGHDVSMAIAGVVASVAGANAYQKGKENEQIVQSDVNQED